MPKLYNNAGNVEIIKGEGNSWAGQIGTYADHRYDLRDKDGKAYAKPFAVFDHKGSGLRAMMRILRGYLNVKDLKGTNGNVSLLGMVNRYAPKIENPTQDYYKNVLAYMKEKNPNFKESAVTQDDIINLTKAKILFENGDTSFTNDQGKTVKFKDYYLVGDSQEDNDFIWQAAEYASRKNLPQSTTWKEMSAAYRIKKATDQFEANEYKKLYGTDNAATAKDKVKLKEEALVEAGAKNDTSESFKNNVSGSFNEAFAVAFAKKPGSTFTYKGKKYLAVKKEQGKVPSANKDKASKASIVKDKRNATEMDLSQTMGGAG